MRYFAKCDSNHHKYEALLPQKLSVSKKTRPNKTGRSQIKSQVHFTFVEHPQSTGNLQRKRFQRIQIKFIWIKLITFCVIGMK